MKTAFTHTKDGTPSGTKAAFSFISFVIAFRLLLGGVDFFGTGVVFPELDLGGAAMLIAAFGGVYAGRRYTESRRNKTSSSMDGYK
ncbi:MAG: hypothetical protein ACN4GR_07015 [Arenicellales bacterium]